MGLNDENFKIFYDTQRFEPRPILLTKVWSRAEQLIDLIDNCDYWEIIGDQIIIVMSIIHMIYKKSHQKLHYAGCFDAKCM